MAEVNCFKIFKEGEVYKGADIPQIPESGIEELKSQIESAIERRELGFKNEDSRMVESAAADLETLQEMLEDTQDEWPRILKTYMDGVDMYFSFIEEYLIKPVKADKEKVVAMIEELRYAK